MARLPVPGGDADQWGTLLNEFLRVAHQEDGSPIIADYTLWVSALAFIIPDSSASASLSFSRGFLGDTLIVTSSATGDLKWIALPLALPSNLRIKGIKVYYCLSNARSFISSVVLTREREPPSALVIHSDPTDLTSTKPTLYESTVSPQRPDGAITLSLRLNFQDSADSISIGAIGIVLGS